MAEETEIQAANTAPPAPGPDNSDGAGSDAAGNGIAAALEAEVASGPGNPDGSGEPPKRGPGRPPTHGRYSKANGSNGKNPVPVAPVQTDGPADVEGARSILATIPDDLREEITVELLSLAEECGRDQLTPLALQCGLSQEEIESELGKAALGERRKTLVAKLLPHAMREWGWDPKITATGALATLVVPPVLRFGYGWVTLARLAKERAKAKPESNGDE